MEFKEKLGYTTNMIGLAQQCLDDVLAFGPLEFTTVLSNLKQYKRNDLSVL